MLRNYEPTKSLLIKYHNNKLIKNPRLRRVTIDISNECNALCPFCNRQVVPEHKLKGLMTKEMFYNIMKQIEQIPSVSEINLMAYGEPMLHPNFDEFVSYIKSKNYNLSFATNLSAANKHFESMLKADNLMFSIEGHDKESYEASRVKLQFEKTYSNVVEFDKLVRQYRSENRHTPKREINYLIDRESKVSEFIDLWGDYVDEIGIRPIFAPLYWTGSKFIQRTPENLDGKLLQMNKVVKNMFCFQPFTSLNIRANGRLALCCSDYNSDLNLGNWEELYDSFLNNENYQIVRSEFRDKKLKICKGCFQNFEVERDVLFRELPDLAKHTANKKIKIYANR